MNRMNRGFTLVELMIVVVILGILAAIGTIGYRKWIGRARSGEAVAMLAEMSSKEQSYKLEFATYLPLRADNKPDLPSPDEADIAFYPLSASSALARFGPHAEQHRRPAPSGRRAGRRSGCARATPVFTAPTSPTPASPAAAPPTSSSGRC